ncbi:MAG: Gfo/Idh/MocA family oxidoreductase [Lentisphaeria bacterium]|nr:Gfo/Idh/MocA family oxidoreductase [Lentisphaeria bacterium]
MAFKICNVGCGGLSNRAHGPSFRHYADTHDDIFLAACCDVDGARANAYRETFGFEHAYTDFREMLTKEQPDAVCLMAPVSLTCELSCAIMEMGYPLLMEKPPGLDGEECRRMVAAAESSGVPNQVSFNRRYAPLVCELKTRLAAFESGAIQNVRYDFFRINRRDADFSTTAIHGIDTTKHIVGSDYTRIRFRYQELPDLGPTTANIYLDCEFACGATAHVNFCPITGVLIERATVCLHDHTFFLNIPIWGAYDSPGRLTHIVKGETVEDVAGDEVCDAECMYIASGFYGENAAFFDDLRAGRRPAGDVKSGLQSVEIADCMRHRLPEYVRA